jgi:hemerythrin
MAFIDWNENFSVNIAEFDEEHKKIVRMLNSLHETISGGKNKEILTSILKETFEYAIIHLRYEEKLMLQYNYPQYKEHRVAHEAFVKKAAEFRNLNAQGLLQSQHLSTMLRDWLINHICGMDKKSSAFLLAAMKDVKS